MKFSSLYDNLTKREEDVNLNEGRMSPFGDVYGDRDIYYHGTSSVVGIGDKLLPPNMTDVLSEKGRLKNLDKVFFTKDIGSAKIYAGRAVQRFGGTPVIYKVHPVGRISTLQDSPGTTVYFADWAYVTK